MFTLREENLCLPENGAALCHHGHGNVSHNLSEQYCHSDHKLWFKATAANMLMLWIMTQHLVLLWAALFGIDYSLNSSFFLLKTVKSNSARGYAVTYVHFGQNSRAECSQAMCCHSVLQAEAGPSSGKHGQCSSPPLTYF